MKSSHRIFESQTFRVLQAWRGYKVQPQMAFSFIQKDIRHSLHISSDTELPLSLLESWFSESLPHIVMNLVALDSPAWLTVTLGLLISSPGSMGDTHSSHHISRAVSPDHTLLSLLSPPHSNHLLWACPSLSPLCFHCSRKAPAEGCQVPCESILHS